MKFSYRSLCKLQRFWLHSLFLPSRGTSCNAHHLRELSWITEFEGKKWADNFKKLLLKSKKLKEESIKNNILFLDKEVLENISKEYLGILENWEKEYAPKEVLLGCSKKS